ncbi:MAG: LAGLIDADG family homing endonuclease [Promethearchaeota archaeon]
MIGIDISKDLEENGDLAEFICIILGDGHVHKRGEKSYHYYGLSISLNRINEKEYVNYVYSLTKRVTGLNPKIYPRKGSKGIDLKVNNKKLIFDLISKGIQTGNKVKNQVNVPEWIKNSDKYIIRGLRGLLDTDGSVWVNNRDKNLGLSFKSASKPLVNDFVEMCKKIGIKSGRILKSERYNHRLNNYYTEFQTQIIGKTHIKRFLDLIKPKKWEFKKKQIEETLISLGSSIEESLKDRRKK